MSNKRRVIEIIVDHGPSVFEKVGKYLAKEMPDLFLIAYDGDGIGDYLELLQQGRKVDAIRLYRERTGCSLLTAKNYIDGLVSNLNL